MSKRPTAIHLDRLAQALSRHGVELKRHQLLDVAANAFGYRNDNEFTAAKVAAPLAEPIGTIQILGATIVLARDAVSDAVFAVEEAFLEQVSLEVRAETYVPTPYGHLADVSRLLDEQLPNLDKEQTLTVTLQNEMNDAAFVIEAIDHDERLYWNDQDGLVNLEGATRYPDKSGTLPSVGLNPTWRTVREAKNLESTSERWVGVTAYQLAKQIVAALPAELRATASFTPQVWINDYACEADAEGEKDYDVTIELIASALRANVETPEEYLDGLGDNDEFQTADESPDWIRDWSGPFEIDVNAPCALLTLNLNEVRAQHGG